MLNDLRTLLIQRLNIFEYKICSQWLIGFIEAEDSFNGKKGEQASFSLSQHTADFNLMTAISKFIGSGNPYTRIEKKGSNMTYLVIYNKSILEQVIIPLCLNNFLTKKKFDQFNTWVKIHFPHISLNHKINTVIEPSWLLGFTEGDGSSFITIRSNNSDRCGFQVQAVFDIAQDSIERLLLDQIGITYFGNYHKLAKSGTIDHLRITNFTALNNYVIPFYSNNTFLSRKGIDFIIWCEIFEIIRSGEHTSIIGVERIKKLRSLQNYFRTSINPKLPNI